MKTDMYTKAILTVIAICLVINVIKDFSPVPSVYAHEKPAPALPESAQIMDVRIVDINTYKEMKVNVNRIDTRDKMQVNLNEIGGGWVSHGGPIEVRVK